MNKKFLRTVFIGLLACPIFLNESAFSYRIDGSRGIYATGVGSRAIPRIALNSIAQDVIFRCQAPGARCTPYLTFRGAKKEIEIMTNACNQMHDLSSSVIQGPLVVRCSASGAEKRGTEYRVNCSCERFS